MDGYLVEFGRMAEAISLIIPAHNEEHFLPQLLESVACAREQYRGSGDQIEVVVADNASTDRTAEIAREHGCHVVHVEQRSIAAVRNGGARGSTGSILAFVDADSVIHPETFNAIEETLTDSVIVGATGIRMSRSSLGIALSMVVVTALLRVGRVDSGVVFCRRADWEAVGGYNDARLFAEDVEFLFALKRFGKPRRQVFTRARNARTITSARKFDRYGDWHYFGTLVRGMGWLFFNRSGFQRFTREYWYGSRE